MSWRSLPPVVALLLLPASACALQRPVAGIVISSDTLPAARLAFDTTLVYAGSQHITLPNGTPAEQHFFLNADSTGMIQRLFWVQFEGPGRYQPGG